MNTNNLMNGDCMMVDNKVIHVYRESNIKEAEPIPITEEFLLGEGYVQVHADWADKMQEEGYPIITFYQKGRLEMKHNLTNRESPYDWSLHVDNIDAQTIGSLDMAYVHEYQQFLRLCGYENEANKVLRRFKI